MFYSIYAYITRISIYLYIFCLFSFSLFGQKHDHFFFLFGLQQCYCI